MGNKAYAWGGWKMPLLHPNDPEYCEYGCPICTRARQPGHPVALSIEKIEMALTGGGCWWGRARKRKYGVQPNEPISAGKPE
ncbi:MAG TPA: hypothetical protein VEP67_07840 [Thiobacillaceae bacterium]|nr:hypothetical protein [Thiobacillaceae bacterium]